MRDEEQRILDLLTIALRTSGKAKEVDEIRGGCRGAARFERRTTPDLPPMGLHEMIRVAARRHGLDPETAAADMDRMYGFDQPPPSVDQLVSMVETRLSALLAKHEMAVETKRRARETVRKRAKPKAAELA